MDRDLEQLKLIASFADALPSAIWVGRAVGGECVYVNAEFERVLGLRPPEGAARGNYVGPYGVHTRSGEKYPEDRMPFELVLRARGPVIVDDLVIHRHDGGKTYLRVFASPLFGASGEMEFVVESFIDITREVEAERERARAADELHHTRRMEAVGSLAGGIAHDFNNLLSIVKLVAASLRHQEHRPDRLEMLQDLDAVADSAASLTRALLGFSGRAVRRADPVGVNALTRTMVGLASRTFDRRIAVRAQLDAKLDTVVGDTAQLEQVIMNLLINARDALGEAGTITVRTRDVVLPAGALPAGSYLALEVEDDGPGIEPALRERIFEPYFTTKAVGQHKGTGLGLATVYGIAQAHAGLIEIASTGTSGTTMRVLLPALPATTAASERQDRGVVHGSGTVLVVDDEPKVLHNCSALLRLLGYDVVAAASGDEAIALFGERPARFCAVLLDLSMPGKGGRETYLALRDMRPGVPVILTTGSALSAEVQDLLTLGVRALLAKPFDAAQLSRCLASVTGGERVGAT